MRIQVTPEDIKNGKPGCGNECPLALAINRKSGRKAYVGVGAVYFDGDGVDTPTYWLPYEAVKFLWDFDRNRPVEPGAFELRRSKEETL